LISGRVQARAAAGRSQPDAKGSHQTLMTEQFITRPRTVLILTPSSRLLGARRSLLALAESLDPIRWRPVVCSQSGGELADACAARKIPFEILKLGWWRKGRYMIWRPFVIARLAELAKQVNADLIHCNEIYPNPYAVRAIRNVPAPAGSPLEGKPIPVVTHVRLQMKEGMIRKYDLRRANRIVVVSESMREGFEEWADHKERVSVIYNGVNLTEFSRMRSAEEARRTLGLPPKGIVFALIGQLGPRKAGDIVLEAFLRIAEEFPDARLIYVGNTHRGQEEFAEKLKARAAASPHAGRVHFFPFTDKVQQFYEAADINLLVSRSEGFGRTIIEAAALGVPSIGAREGGIQEIIVHESSGLLVEPENSAVLAVAMRTLAADDTLRHNMADAAFRRIAQNFSSQVHTERMMDLYDQVLEEAAHAG
jgi:glycosyltransferase involved in cell wall biosynthesis